MGSKDEILRFAQNDSEKGRHDRAKGRHDGEKGRSGGELEYAGHNQHKRRRGTPPWRGIGVVRPGRMV